MDEHRHQRVTKEHDLPAILVADIDIHDPEDYAAYRSANPDIVRKYGGRYLAVGAQATVLEGDWIPRRTVIIEFPDIEAVKAFYESPEYARVRGIRWRSADSRLVAFETKGPS